MKTSAKHIRRILLLTISVFGMIGCTPSQKNSEKESVVLDTVRISEFSSDSCGCVMLDRHRQHKIGIFFRKHDRFQEDYKKRTAYTLEKYSQDSVRLKVKSISFSDFDTIPEKFRVFENVEKVVIWHSFHGIKGLDIFPRLKEIQLFGSKIRIDSTERWPSQIRVVDAEKSRILDLKSFRKTPQLVSLKMVFSDFDNFPVEIESLNCLTEVELNAYTGQIDLGKIDLAKFRCLKKGTFEALDDSMTGFPGGLNDTTKTIDLTIHHAHLTKREKTLIRKYTDRAKKMATENKPAPGTN